MEPHPLVFEAQFKELSALREFLSNDDMVARQEFDIPAIMDKNIGIQQLRIMFFRAGNKAMFPYQIYAQDGGWIVMVREGNYNASRGKINMGESIDSNGVGVVEGKKDVLFLIMTNKYQAAMTKLTAFINSPLILDTIKEPLKGLKATVANDIQLIFTILNERLQDNEDYFMKFREPNTKFTSVITNDYASRFIPLSPFSSSALQKIQQYLRTD